MLNENGGGFDIDDSSNVFTLNQVISGTGGLTKLGDGTLVVNEANTFSGHSRVEDGCLFVGDSVSNNAASILGDVTVGELGTLAGYGGVGANLTNRGLLSAGADCNSDEITTFNIGGDYVQSPAGTIHVDLNREPAENDALAIGGDAQLDGGIDLHTDDGSTWYSSHVLVETEGEVKGVFGEVGVNLPNLDPVVSYEPKAVLLDLYRHDVVFEKASDLTKNQLNTAIALDDLPKDGELYRNILIEGPEAHPETLDQLSGELHAGVAAAQLSSERIVRDVNLSRMREHVQAHRNNTETEMVEDAKGGLQTITRPLKSNGFAVWANVVADQLDIDGDHNAAGVDQTLQGAFVGANILLGQGWSAGLAFGYTDADVDVQRRRSSADVESLSLTGPVGRSFQTDNGFVNVLLGGSYTSSDIESRRRVEVGRINDNYTADYESDAVQIFGELGYEFEISEKSRVEPFVRLGWTEVSTDFYREKGGLGALHSSGFENDRLTSLVGVRFFQDFETGSIPTHFQGMIGWEHNFGDEYATSTHSFNGTGPFEIDGASSAEDIGLIGLGLDFEVSEAVRVGASYIGRFSSDERDDTLHLKTSWAF